MNNRKISFSLLAFFFYIATFPSITQANNLTLSNVKMGPRNVSTKSVSVLFDVSWDNSWRNKINHDAVWLIARLSDSQELSSGKNLCQLTVAGLNPSGTAVGTNTDLEVYIPGDKVGAFIQHAKSHSVGTVSSQNVMLTLNYDSCGFNENSQIAVSLFALEMVYVPRGSFYAGDNATSVASFRQGASDAHPWPIASESAISVANVSSGGYYYSSAGSSGEFSTGASFSIPAQFPKGYGPFYTMKYEITEGEWVDFVNSLPTAARSFRDLTNNIHKNADSVVSRNTVACSGSPLVCTTQRPSRPVSYLSWADLTAFLDWVALRPMTELEFEKAARGPVLPLNSEFSWGSADIVPVDTISGSSEEGDETVLTSSANARFNSVLLSGGDSAPGQEYQNGPLRSGIFATSISDRKIAGAGYYGTMEFSGNLKEWVVSIGRSESLAFAGQEGNGYLTTLTGYEGNADVLGWPGLDVNVAKGITGSLGVGFRGGSWASTSDRLRISDRQEATLSAADAADTYGGRGVRTFDGE